MRTSAVLCLLALTSATAYAFQQPNANQHVSFRINKKVPAAAVATTSQLKEVSPVSSLFEYTFSDKRTSAVTAVAPSAEVVLRQAFFDTLVPDAVILLTQLLKSIDIPDVETVADVPVLGKVDFTLSSIEIEGFDVNSDRSFLNLGENFGTLAFADISARINAKWRFRQKKFPHTKGDGSAVIKAKRGNIAANVAVDASPEGYLQIAILDSVTQFASFDIDTKGSALSWLINVITDIFKKSIRTTIIDQINGLIQTTVPEKANTLLRSLPLSIGVASLVNLDIGFARPVTINNNFLDIRNDLLISAANGAACPYPSGLSTRTHADTANILNKMARAYIDQSVIQCAAWAAFEQLSLKATIAQKNLPPQIVILDTESWEEVIPAVYELYPNRPMEIDASVVEVPIVTLSRSAGGVAGVTAVLKFFVIEKSGARTPLFDLGAYLRISLEDIVILQSNDYKTNKLKIAIKSIEIDTNILGSNVGEIDIEPVQETFEALASLGGFIVNTMIPQIELPELPYIRLVKPVIEYSEKEVAFASDFILSSK